MSFVQVRGSVPVYWSQPGYKYRPPPRLDRGKFELKTAFTKEHNGSFLYFHDKMSNNLQWCINDSEKTLATNTQS